MKKKKTKEPLTVAKALRMASEHWDRTHAVKSTEEILRLANEAAKRAVQYERGNPVFFAAAGTTVEMHVAVLRERGMSTAAILGEPEDG